MRAGFALTTSVLVAIACVDRAAADEYSPTTLTAAEILAKSDAASGRLTSGQYLIVRRYVTPSQVTTSMTQTNGDDYITVETSGNRTEQFGSYQGQRWERNANGIVVRESGFHGAADPNALAWKNPSDPQYRVQVLGLTQNAPEEYVVEANPPGGQDEYRYYDAQTFLLDKDVIFGVDRYRHETDYSDYHAVFGETIAFHTHYSDGRPENEESDSVESFTASPTQASLAIPDTQPLFGFLSAPVTLPAQFSDDDGIIVPVQIDGQTLKFVLDSGSSDLFIDAGAVSRLGLATYGKSSATIAGTFTQSTTTISEFTVGGLTVRDATFSVGPLTVGDQHVVGLLGCDFLASAIVGINFRDKEVKLYPWATFNPASLGVVAMPMQLDDCVPRVPLSIESVPGQFLLDTGSFGTLVYRHYLARLPRAPVAQEGDTPDTTYAGTSVTAEAIGGKVQTTFYNVSDVVFGGARFGVGQVLVPSASSTFQDPDYDGIVGRNILQDFVFFLDYNDGVIFIKPQ